MNSGLEFSKGISRFRVVSAVTSEVDFRIGCGRSIADANVGPLVEIGHINIELLCGGVTQSLPNWR